MFNRIDLSLSENFSGGGIPPFIALLRVNKCLKTVRDTSDKSHGLIQINDFPSLN